MALTDKINYIQSIHNKPIDLSLERIKLVAKRLQLLHFNCPIITVGGTNGKGTTVATLEQLYLTSGYCTGTFTSPQIHTATELIRINGINVTEEKLEQTLDTIDITRKKILLTEFEFMTLAALWLFKEANLDIIILEVGLGGRDDAVNIIAADITIITNVALDHCQWLGNDRESIAKVKAGIMRRNKVTILGERDPAKNLLLYAKNLDVSTKQLGKDFDYVINKNTWTWTSAQQNLIDLPLSNFITENIASAIMAIIILQEKLPISKLQKTLQKTLSQLSLPGRMQTLNYPCLQIFDVAHNPAAALKLAEKLKNLPKQGKTYAVFSMFTDKDIANTIKPFKNLIDKWHIAKLKHPRAANLSQLQKAFALQKIEQVKHYNDINTAYHAVLKMVKPKDYIIIFGSFATLHEIELPPPPSPS